ncbi:MAG: rhodanese-like domain-containing protein [Gammaproteobacteria bacterium]|nr:rhodanese-like domain-containing protein [Gammaproteobacteria bacterium]
MSLKTTLFSIVTISLLSAGVASAINSENSSSPAKKKQTQLGLYLDASEAYKKVTDQSENVLFVDVRTRAEINFLGMPQSVDVNIPYMTLNEWYVWNEEKKNFKLEVNSQFVNVLNKRLAAKGLTKNDIIILLCRSGSRSAKAADLLTKNGFKKVYSVVDGFEGDKSKSVDSKGQRVINGWKNAGLPWSYKLDKNKMFIVE